MWRETEKSWTPALVAALLGLDLEVDAADEMGRPNDEGEKASAVGPPRHGRARVSGYPGTEVTVEVPTLRDLKLALSFNGAPREPDVTTQSTDRPRLNYLRNILNLPTHQVSRCRSRTDTDTTASSRRHRTTTYRMRRSRARIRRSSRSSRR